MDSFPVASLLIQPLNQIHHWRPVNRSHRHTSSDADGCTVTKKEGENARVKAVGMSSSEIGGYSPPAAGSIFRRPTGGRVCKR